ncbi:MAG: septum formation protein Maf [Xanthomonadales bacterium]|nr:septum formation protein Maf [Xanthomonadales bacterium]
MSAAPVVLASTSRYRRALLARLLPRFECVAPAVDESAGAGELPARLASRLASAKARAVAALRPGAVVIGSDQVAELDGVALGKPGDAATARAQLLACAGREVRFHTAVCVIGADGRARRARDLTRVRFLALDPGRIETYLDREQPFDCAGSFKAEALGIALFQAIHSRDPTALVGLPLIATCRLLRAGGVEPLAATADPPADRPAGEGEPAAA